MNTKKAVTSNTERSSQPLFDEQSCNVMARLLKRLQPHGYLMIGADEKLPDLVPGVVSLNSEPHIFQKIAGPQY